MKKFVPILGVSILLALGSIGAVAISSSNKENQANADYVTPRYSGLYERIDDPSTIKPGDKVILGTKAGRVFDGIGGNPAYAQANYDGVQMFAPYVEGQDYWTEDRTKFMYLDNKDAVELTVEKGYIDNPNWFSFKGSFWAGQHNDYLGENNEDNNYATGYYSEIAYFLSDFGMRPVKDAKSTWELTFESEAKVMKMRKVLYDDGTSFLCYDHRGARHHFCFGDDPCTNLYRKLNDEDYDRGGVTPAPTVEPNKTVYHKGDTIDYDGLVVTFRIFGANDTYKDYDLQYNSETARFFSTPATVDINTTIPVRIFDRIGYVIDITITTDASGYQYNLVNSFPADIRGTYLLSLTNGRVLNGSHETGYKNNYTDKGDDIIISGVLSADEEKLDESIVRIVRTKIGNNYYYHAINYLGKYLCVSNESETNGGYTDYYVGYADDPSVENAVTITTNSFKIGNYYLADSNAMPSSKWICFIVDNYDGIRYFKLSNSTSHIVSQVNEFITLFERETSVCENADEEDIEKIDDALWGRIKAKYEELSCDAQGIFTNTTYTHGAEALETKENVVDRYDYILDKYNKEDFMLRRLVNTFESHFEQNSLLSSLTNEDNIVLSIVIAICVTTISTALVIIIKRRKQA